MENKLEDIKEIFQRQKCKSYKKYLESKIAFEDLDWLEREIAISIMNKDKYNLAKVFNTVSGGFL